MTNMIIRRDLQKQKLKKKSTNTALIIALASMYTQTTQPDNNEGLWRYLPNDLPIRFLV
jgi:hypothetical protein